MLLAAHSAEATAAPPRARSGLETHRRCELPLTATLSLAASIYPFSAGKCKIMRKAKCSKNLPGLAASGQRPECLTSWQRGGLCSHVNEASGHEVFRKRAEFSFPSRAVYCCNRGITMPRFSQPRFATRPRALFN